MNCGRCGGALSAAARFCGDCGARVPAPRLRPPPGLVAQSRSGRSSGPAAAARRDEPGALTFSGLVAGRWALVLPDGQAHRIEGPLLVGRRPDPALGPRGARFITIEDPRRTVSRSHLVLAPSLGGVRVTDVSGRNGVRILGADGSEQHCSSGSVDVSAPSRLVLGLVALELRPA